MSRTVAMALVLTLSMAFCIFPPLPVSAASRTIVVLDHYPTILSALESAENGDTVFFREGTYEGPINQTIFINKTISIVGDSTSKTVLKLYPAYNLTWILTAPFFDYSDAIAVSADNFSLLNLTVIVANPGGYISATGNGIHIADTNITMGPSTGVAVHGSYSKINRNTVGGFIEVNGTFNEIAANSAYSIYTYGSFNIVQKNKCQGIMLYNSTDNVCLENEVSTDSRSYSGFDITHSYNNLFYKNRVSGFSSGFRLWFSPENTFKANTVADSLTASVDLGASPNNTFCLNNFVDNPSWTRGYVYDQYSDPNYRNAFPNMTASTSLWYSESLGNHWGDYNGTDTNGDGIGDLPHTIKFQVYSHDSGYSDFVCGQDNFPLMIRVDIDSVAVDLPAWVAALPPEQLPINPIPEEPEPSPEPTSTPEPTTEPETIEPEPSPTTLLIATGVLTAIICAGVLAYFKKRSRRLEEKA